MEGLKIPADHKYILVRCSIADNQGDFTNERGNIIEMEGPDHGNIPSIISAGPVEYKGLRNSYLQSILSKFNKYIQLPEVQAELLDQKKWDKHFHDYYSFHEDYLSKGKITNLYTLDREGYIAAACGKPEYMLGVLNPTYPEVREYWLDMVRYCLDRGVDGINFRHENHIRSSEYWEYGFNDPVIEAAGGKTDYASIMRINGDAYTQFLIEARDLVKSYGKSIALHLHTHMLFPDDRGYLIGLPPNFEWQWQKWIKEIADEFELRGITSLRSWNLRQVLDIFSSVTKEANKPFYVQGIVGDGKRPYEFTTQEMNMINNHPGVDGYILYETASYTRINKNNELEGSNTFKNLIKTNFF